MEGDCLIGGQGRRSRSTLAASFNPATKRNSHGHVERQRQGPAGRCRSLHPVLWALRDTLGLTGTKFGCGQALCGACTVHLERRAIRSCVTPISAAEGQKITTIEPWRRPRRQAVQAAWVKHDVAHAATARAAR
jgi:aerobic-type carbon monoxide dehydrogenase small subunit (CoxS/CutS family)